MLICADLSQAFPDALIPEVRLEDLDKYGDFELVKVSFALGGRSVQAVSDEIKPLLEPNGRSTIFPQSKRVLVTARAGKMRAVSVVIASIPEPRRKEPQKPKPPAPKPELQVYPVESLDLKATAEMLDDLVGGAKITVDEQAGQLNVFAVPSQQGAIKKYLDAMKEPASAERQAKLEVYLLERELTGEFIEQLKALAPGATMAGDSDPARLAVFARPDQHRKLQELLGPPSGMDLEMGDRRADVYTLKHAEPDELADVIENLLPKAEVATDEAGGRMVVVATSAQHAILAQMIQQFDSPPAADRELKFYPLPDRARSDLQDILQSFVPKAEIQIQTDPRRLMVIASPEEQTTVDRLLTQLGSTSNDVPQKRLRVYTVTAEQRKQFVATYKQIAPELETITIQETSRPDELQIVADEAQQQRIAEWLQELKEQFPDAPRKLKFYDLPASLRARFLSLKDQLAPELRSLQVVDGDRPDRLGVVASDVEHAQVADLLQQLQTELPVEESQLQVYPTSPSQRKRFLAILPSLQNELPGIRLIETSVPTELTIWARPAQHQRLAELLNSLADGDNTGALQLVAYPVEQGDPESILAVLQELYPDTKIVADSETSRVLVWTTPTEHEQIEQAVQQMDAPAAAGKNKMVYYPLGEVDVRDVLRMFEELVPNMSLVADRDSNSIIAWGSEKDHALLKKTAEDFRQQAEVGGRQIVSYPIGSRSTREVEFILRAVVPGVPMGGDEKRRAVIAWATPEEHKRIQQTMLELTGGAESERGELRVYTITRMSADDVVEALEQIAPAAQISIASDQSQILVWADSETHKQIRATLDKIEAGDPDAQKGTIRIYQGRPEVLAQIKGLLPQVAPEAELMPDTQTDRLTVWAQPQEHTAIETQLKSLEDQLQPIDLQLATYPLQRASTAEATQLLQSVIPDLQFLTSADPQQLLIRARPEDHTLIQKTLAELDQVLSQPQATEVKVYSLGSMAPDTLTPLLDPKLTAGMSVIPDAERKALVVRGTAEQHIELKAAIDEILLRLADAPEKVSKVYRFQHADPAATRLTLLQLLPTSAFVVDLAARSLTANALPADHERIEQIIQQLDQPPNDNRETVVYRLEQGDVYALLTTLRSLLPEAVFGVDRSSRTLVATASPTDQQRIRQVVQQMDDPEFRALETRVYRVQMRRLYSLRYSLNAISPDAIIVTDEDNGLLVATASPADHEKIQAIIKQLNDSQAETRETKVYHFQYADPASVRLTLLQMLPRSLLSIDPATKSLIANASPEDQLRIDEMVQQLDQPADDGRETAVYRLQEGDVYALLNSLQSLLPNVAFGVDRSSRTLIATATPEEQERISKVVEEMDDPEFSAMETKVYRVEMGELYSLRYALRSLSREAIIVTDEENGLLVATASPADQKKISAVITQLNDPEANQRETKVYRLQAGELYGVRQALRSMLPRASISVDDENRAILVTASTEDHARIKQVLDELDSPDADTRQTKVYRLKYGDVYAAQSALEALLPQAVIAADRSTRALVATASTADHLRIDTALQELDAAREDPTETRVYNFELGDVEAAETVLEELLPEAVFAVDTDNKLLVATASPSEHERIQATVKELDRPNAEQPSLQAYRIVKANFQSVYEALDDVFRRQYEVRISADPENQTILVQAPPEEHRTIAQLVSQMENASDESLRRRLVVYPLKGEADDSVLNALQDLFTNQQPEVELSLDTTADQVLAVATEKQHELIRGAVEQMQGGETLMEVFPLQTMDPFFAELAIDRLYTDDNDPPVANGDSETQQLIVRGTRKQLDEIKQLLSKMGELPTTELGGSDGVRVIPFRGDVREAVEKIQMVWPRLRGNPLRVIQPTRVLTPLQPQPSDATPAAEPAPAPPTSTAPTDAAPGTPPPTSPAPAEQAEQPTADRAAHFDRFLTIPVAAVDPPTDANAPVESDGILPQRVESDSSRTADLHDGEPVREKKEANATNTNESVGNRSADPSAKPSPQEQDAPAASVIPPAAATPAAAEPAAEPAVVLVPGQDSITVMSDDPEALMQVETLLRTLARQSSMESGGGNFAVYALTNAGAGEVAQTLDQLFEKMPFTARVLQPREHRAGRTTQRPDRPRSAQRSRLIEELLQVLDSANVPNLLVSGPPTIVPLQHTDAQRIVEILQGIYASQLRSGGTGPRISIPRGVPSEVASMLKQMNAAAAGPLLTLEVDEVTNSIVIMAPKLLAEEVSQLVHQLDQKAQAEDTRRIEIVPLKSAKAEELEDALQDLLRNRSRGRGR